jgi:hypothetical protein
VIAEDIEPEMRRLVFGQVEQRCSLAVGEDRAVYHLRLGRRPADPPRTSPPLAYYPALSRKRGDKEPETFAGWCPVCDTDSMRSALILAGIL